MDVEIKTLEPVKVAYMRHTGPYETCHETWMKFNRWCFENNMYSQDCLVIGASWDDPAKVPAEKLRYDCCISVGDDFRPDDQVQVQELEGGKYALYRLVGSYSKIPEAFRMILREWMPKEDVEPRMTACMEIYRTDPGQTSEDENITDILVPLK